MAIRIPIITDLQDQGLKRAKLAFGDFKKSVSDAQGGMNKFKAGTKSVLDSVKANAGTFAIAGAAAFAAFAAKGIQAFQSLALEAGKFSDATGLAVDDASRWMEVGKDIGIGSDAIQTGINKMNKTLGTTPNLFKQLGIEVATTDGHTTDVNGTFLNVIQKLKGIKDPAEKAKVATQLLGKGWQSMAELINMGSGVLKNNLKEVSSQQVISPAELAKAKKFRDSMDKLADAGKRVSIAFGQFLVPIVTDIVDLVNQSVVGLEGLYGQLQKRWHQTYFSSWWNDLQSVVPEVIQVVKDGINGFSQQTVNMTVGLNATNHELDIFRTRSSDVASMIQNHTNPQIDSMAQKLINAKTATDNATAAWSNLLDKFQTQVNLDKLDADLITLRDTAIAAFGGGKKELDAFHAAQLVVIQDFDEMKSAFPPSLTTMVTIELNSMDLERLDRAANLVRFLKAGIGSNGTDASIFRRVSAPIVSGARASGGPVMAGKSYLVGERGPELFTPGTSGGITSNGAMNNGTTINVTVNGGDPNSIVRALQQYVRQSGPVPVNTRAM